MMTDAVKARIRSALGEADQRGGAIARLQACHAGGEIHRLARAVMAEDRAEEAVRVRPRQGESIRLAEADGTTFGQDSAGRRDRWFRY